MVFYPLLPEVSPITFRLLLVNSNLGRHTFSLRFPSSSSCRRLLGRLYLFTPYALRYSLALRNLKTYLGTSHWPPPIFSDVLLEANSTTRIGRTHIMFIITIKLTILQIKRIITINRTSPKHTWLTVFP